MHFYKTLSVHYNYSQIQMYIKEYCKRFKEVLKGFIQIKPMGGKKCMFKKTVS